LQLIHSYIFLPEVDLICLKIDAKFTRPSNDWQTAFVNVYNFF